MEKKLLIETIQEIKINYYSKKNPDNCKLFVASEMSKNFISLILNEKLLYKQDFKNCVYVSSFKE